MLKKVFITQLVKFLPNDPIPNEELEEYLGKIKGLRSKAKALVLRNNGIKSRYYALTKDGECTHTNVELTVECIKKLNGKDFSVDDIELLACGTASPDQMMPSHSSMVHGLLGINALDAMTATGSCNSAMWALNYAYMAIQTGAVKNAVCTGSEKISSWMQSRVFEEESKRLEELGENPYVAFEKEFLRWMLSDGAAAALLQPTPGSTGISLQIDWIEIRSYADRAKTCMYAGAKKDENGELIPWRNLEPREWVDESIFSLKQDSRLLEHLITNLGGEFLLDLMEKHEFKANDVDYFLPHMSSEFFRKKIKGSLEDYGIVLPEEKWFTNLHKVGNVGAASGFLMLEELYSSGKLKPGNTILLMIPESARFSYTFAHLTVV